MRINCPGVGLITKSITCSRTARNSFITGGAPFGAPVFLFQAPEQGIKPLGHAPKAKIVGMAVVHRAVVARKDVKKLRPGDEKDVFVARPDSVLVGGPDYGRPFFLRTAAPQNAQTVGFVSFAGYNRSRKLKRRRSMNNRWRFCSGRDFFLKTFAKSLGFRLHFH